LGGEQPVPIEEEAGWVPELVVTFSEREYLSPARNQMSDYPACTLVMRGEVSYDQKL
jgi:hypothetical protein